MSWMKKRFLELMSIFLIDIEFCPTHKLCETTMQSLERRHSELDIVRNQCACDTFFFGIGAGPGHDDCSNGTRCGIGGKILVVVEDL